MLNLFPRYIAIATLAMTVAVFPGCPPVAPPDDDDQNTIGWSRTIGGDGDDAAHALEQTADGGFIAAGLVEPSHDETDDVLLIKMNKDGGEMWRAVFGDDRDDAAMDVDQTADGGYIAAGRFGAQGHVMSDAFLLKTDKNGVEEHRVTIDSGGADHAVSIDERPDGGYYIAVQLDSLGASEATIIAYNAQLVEQWRVSAGPGTLAAEAETLATGEVVFGYWRLQPRLKQADLRSQVELLKLDGNGVKQWLSVLPSEEAVVLRAMDSTPDGGFILCGESDFLDENSRIFLWKTDGDGILQWLQEHGGDGRHAAHKVRAIPSGGYIVAGETSPPDSSPHAFLLKAGSNGELVWMKEFGGDDHDMFHDVAAVSDGFVAIGKSESFAPDSEPVHHDIHMVRTSHSGETPSGEGMVD